MKIRTVVALLLLAGVMTLCSSCALVGALLSKVVPPESSKAVFKPPHALTLVIVENFKNPSSAYLESEQLSRYLSGEFQANNVFPLIDPAELYKFKDAHPDYRTMSIPKIGQALGAAQVVYVDVAPLVTEGAGVPDVEKMTLTARVRIVDVSTAQALWPSDPADGFAITAENRPSPGAILTEPVIREGMCKQLADQIARLFYDVKGE